MHFSLEKNKNFLFGRCGNRMIFLLYLYQNQVCSFFHHIGHQITKITCMVV